MKKTKTIDAWAVFDTYLFDKGLTEEMQLIAVLKEKSRPLFNQKVLPCTITYELRRSRREK